MKHGLELIDRLWTAGPLDASAAGLLRQFEDAFIRYNVSSSRSLLVDWDALAPRSPLASGSPAMNLTGGR